MISNQPLLPESSVPQVINSAGNFHPGNAVLFLFSPREIGNHFKRPLTYNFNNETAEAILNNIVTDNGPHSVRKVLNTVPNIHQSVIPNSQGIVMGTSTYSQNWIFVLIFDEDSQKSVFTSNKLINRTILMGICGQEPISATGVMSATPEQFLNPNCQLIVTKHLKMTKYSTMGARGYTTQVKTVIDDNIAPYDQNVWGVSNNTRDNSFFTLMPGDVHRVIDIDPHFGGHSSFIDYSNAINTKGFAKITSQLESPKRHMKEILTAFDSGIANMSYSPGVGGFGDGISNFEHQVESFGPYVHGALEESHQLNTMIGTNEMTMGDMVGGYINIGMIMAKYCPKIFPVMVPTGIDAEIIPQNITNINNIFSSLVCAVMPTYLNIVGLSAVSFMYNSPNDAFNVLHIESALIITQEEYRHKWKSLEFLLRNELFPVLYGNGGEFDIQVMSSINSTTDVVLNFLDFSLLPFGAIYRENSVLGGIVSPLVGNGESLVDNSAKLNALISNVESQVVVPRI